MKHDDTDSDFDSNDILNNLHGPWNLTPNTRCT